MKKESQPQPEGITRPPPPPPPLYASALRDAGEAERLLRLVGVDACGEDSGDQSLEFLRQGHSPEVADISIAIGLVIQDLRAENSKQGRTIECLDQQVCSLQADLLRRISLDSDPWHWIGDGNDDLDTLACPILIMPHDLRALLESENAALKEALARAEAVTDAAVELVEVAELRGDNALPSPCDDPLLWTARMQDAWNYLETALEATNEEPQL